MKNSANSCYGAPESKCLSGHIHTGNMDRYYMSKGIMLGPSISGAGNMGSARCVYDPPGEAIE